MHFGHKGVAFRKGVTPPGRARMQSLASRKGGFKVQAGACGLGGAGLPSPAGKGQTESRLEVRA